YYPIMKVAASFQGLRAEGSADRETDGAESEAAEDTDQRALQDRFGRMLLDCRHPVLRQYLLDAQQGNRQITEQLRQNATGGRAARRIRELEEEQRLVCLALEQFEQK
ncbi:MAG: hypothetical protein K2I21_01760, partial [Acetatifactor sp.]|nr:hypothetical protein [Acetatifactor sp.]